MKILIPPLKKLTKTSDSDPIVLYYLPLVKYPFILRLKKTVSLLKNKKYKNMLEIGTGSGILIPELKRHAVKLYCVDVHNNIDKVSKFVKNNNLGAKVEFGDIYNLKYKPKTFDAIVCISVLEHLNDVKSAVNSIYELLSDEGVAVFGIPTRSKIGETICELIAPGHKNRHVSSDKKILRELREKFDIIEYNNLNIFPGINHPLYISCKCIKK